MPLTLELWGRSPMPGRLIIAGNNLIIQFIPKTQSEKHLREAMYVRDRFSEILEAYRQHVKVVLKSDSFEKLLYLNNYPMKDPRHHITTHMCAAEADLFHAHITFENPVNAETMRIIFDSLAEFWTNYVSRECLQYLKATVEEYFFDKKNIAMDLFYQQEKNQELERKSAGLLTYRLKEVKQESKESKPESKEQKQKTEAQLFVAPALSIFGKSTPVDDVEPTPQNENLAC